MNTSEQNGHFEKLLTPDEAAGALGISLRTLYTWVYRRQIPAQKVGRLLRFSPSALARWLAAQAQPATGKAHGQRAVAGAAVTKRPTTDEQELPNGCPNGGHEGSTLPGA